MKLWRRPEPVQVPESVIEAVGSQPLAELLYRRGHTTPEAASAYLTGGVDADAPGLPDLETGVALVQAAVRSGRRICVYGDYDTDGVTATSLLVSLLQFLGADVTYYIPNRFKDGYGMNGRVVEALAGEGVSLILTCDCGIRNHAEVALARRLGLTVVVTDHHELGPTLPEADAVINPKRLAPDHPCYMLPGVGTAYLFARQMLRALDLDPAGADQWLDLVAVGIIADVVPLTHANRELGRRGLSRLNTSPRPGLQALMAVAGLEGRIDEEAVAFQLVPRLNAAGRLADGALGVRLMLSPGLDEARSLAHELDRLNQERKQRTASVVEAAVAEVAEGAGAILLYHSEWHEGVLGIAAGKLAEEYGVPALLMARKQGGGILVGSARAPEGFPLHEALEACGEHLLKYGGHAAAAGFSLLEDRFAAFRAAMLEEVRRRTRPQAVQPVQAADLALPLASIDRTLYDDLCRAAPFGEANPAPVIFSPAVKLLSARPIGPGEKHLRLVLRDGEGAFTGIWWGAGGMKLEPQEIDLFYRLSLNRWNGEELIQVVVEHLGPGVQAAQAAPALMVARPELVDRRSAAPQQLIDEFAGAAFYAEGALPFAAVDRYRVSPTVDLVMLTPPPSPRLLEEILALSGARRLVLGWPKEPAPGEDRFLPMLMRAIGEETAHGPYVRVARLAARSGELETVIRAALAALEESDLLVVEEDDGDVVRLRRRSDSRGIKESEALARMRRLLGESRAFRRFLRTAPVYALERALW